MITCKIDGELVSTEIIHVSSVGFGQPVTAALLLPYQATIDASSAIEKFGQYYSDFIGRERQGSDEFAGANSYFLRLRDIEYPSIGEMIGLYPGLLAEILRLELPAEFLGYCFNASQKHLEIAKFVIHNLTYLIIEENIIICRGEAFRFAHRCGFGSE